MRIAVYVNEEGCVASFYETGVVRLYEKYPGAWTVIRELPLEMQRTMSIPEVRLILKKTAAQLENCRVFMAAEVKGVPYSILEGLGYTIWRSQGVVERQLDYVEGKELEAIEAAKRPRPAPLAVGDVRDGYYRINLAHVLAGNPGISSKQILIPFLEKNAFQKLEILCEHAPRWFDSEFPRLKCHAETELPDARGHELKITVYPDN